MPRGVPNKPQRQPAVTWTDPAFKPFGDRVDFLSPERQQLATGRLVILPAKEREKKDA